MQVTLPFTIRIQEKHSLVVIFSYQNTKNRICDQKKTESRENKTIKNEDAALI